MTDSFPLRAPTAELVASMLRDGLDVQLRLAGWSMKPFLRSGTILRFSAAREPVLGDVALTRHGNDTLVAHRVVALGPDWVQTKGDSCLALDARVPRESVLGCAVSLRSWRCLPLRNGVARALGRVTNRIYPRLAKTYRAFLPRKEPVEC